jgi:hypothetical protein
MSRILIETYRTWDIWFDTNSEKFIAENGLNENEKGKPSLTAARKFVDEFRKANAEFKPFEIVGISRSYRGDQLKIIGIRKDGRYVAEDSKGQKQQISEYSEKDYGLPNADNSAALAEISRLENERDRVRELIQAEEQKLVSATLHDFKKTQDYSDFTA